MDHHWTTNEVPTFFFFLCFALTFIFQSSWQLISKSLCHLLLKNVVSALLFSSVQLLSHVRPLATPWTAACQASLSITNSQNLLKLMSIESVMPSNHLTLCPPLLSHLQSFLATGSFPMRQLFTSGGPSIRFSGSTSVLPMNIQD